MKKIVLSIFIFLLGSAICLSQKIYFCKEYPNSDQPYEPGTSFTINSSGIVKVYILYQNGGRAMNMYAMSFYIDRLNGNDYTPWDTKIISVSPSTTYYVLAYSFSSSGDYRVTASLNGVELAKEYISINASGNSTSTSGYTSSAYKKPTITLGTDIDANSGYLYNSGTSFSLNPSHRAWIYCKVTDDGNTRDLDEITYVIYKYNGYGHFDSLSSNSMNSKSAHPTWTYFIMKFESEGSYQVKVYDANWYVINTASLMIRGSSGPLNQSSSQGTTTNTVNANARGIYAGTGIDANTGAVFGATGSFAQNSNVYLKVCNGSYSFQEPEMRVSISRYGVSISENFYKLSGRDWVFITQKFNRPGVYDISVATVGVDSAGDDDYKYFGSIKITIY